VVAPLIALLIARTESPAPVAELVRDLVGYAAQHSGRDDSERDNALERLAEIGSEATPTLIELCRSEVPEIKTAVLQTFGEVRDKRASAAIYRIAATDPTDWMRSHARDVLGYVATPEQADALLGWAADGDRGAFWGIAHAGDPRGVPTVVKALGKTWTVVYCGPTSVHQAGLVLSFLGQPGIAALEHAFDTGSDDEALDAVEGLSRSKSPRAKEFLVKRAVGDGPRSALAVQHTYGLSDPRLIAKMISQLDADPADARTASYLLDQGKVGAFVQAANRCLDKGLETEWFIGLIAEDAIYRRILPGSPQVKALLRRTLQMELTENLIDAWGSVGVEESIPRLLREIRTKGNFEHDCLVALGSMGVAGVKAALAMLDRGEVAEDRLFSFIVAVDDRTAAPLLRRFLSAKTERDILRWTIEVLGRLKDRAPADQVVALGESSPKELGSEVASYLAAIGDSRANGWVERYGLYASSKDGKNPWAGALLTYYSGKSNLDPKYTDSYADDLLVAKGVLSSTVLRGMLAKDDGRKAVALRILGEIGDKESGAAAIREMKDGSLFKRFEAWRAAKKLRAY
jgi:HEAT repeat protein